MIRFKIKKYHYPLILCFTLSFMLSQMVLPIFLNNFSVFAQDTQTCVSQLNQAEDDYYNGAFDASIRIIKECLKKATLKKEERIKAYTILARIFMAKNKKEGAKKIIRKILNLDPGYRPTIEQERPAYVNLVAEERKTLRVTAAASNKKKAVAHKNNKKWYWYSAGGAAGIAIIAIIAGGQSKHKPGNNSTLPQPPGFPK